MKNTNNNWKLERAREIVKLLCTGIEEENGEIRDFNILDYYRIINISPSSLYECTVADLRKDFSELEIKNFYSFVIRSLSNTKLTVKAIMEVKHLVMIGDKSREITDFEKNCVINYLKTNKLPLTSDTYAIALKNYLDGKLSLEKNKTLAK